jgi:hypothetical protein
MFIKLKEVAEIMYQNWEENRKYLEKGVRTEGLTLNILKLNLIIGIIMIVVLSVVCLRILLIYIVILVSLLAIGLYINYRSDIFVNYIYSTLLSWFFSFNLFYFLQVSDLHNLNNVSFSIYLTITTVLLFITPYLAYMFTVKGLKNTFKFENIDRIKNEKKIIMVAYMLPGSLGIAIDRFLRNSLSEDLNNIIMLILFAYSIVIFVFFGFLCLYKGMIYYINDKKMRTE